MALSLRFAARQLRTSAWPTLRAASTGRPSGTVLQSFPIRTKSTLPTETSDSLGFTNEDLKNPMKRRELLRRSQHAGSIFDENSTAEQSNSKASQDQDGAENSLKSRTFENTRMTLDPDPRSRVRWQRKKVIQMVQRRGQLMEKEKIKASEREHTLRSHRIATSMKKLQMLSRQVAGKPVDEAIEQMKWSKKKAAREVFYWLEQARDEAVVKAGMGLGAANQETLAQAKEIKTADGKWVKVSDPTKMYVAQSWVGRAPLRKRTPIRIARGRMNILDHPTTRITFLLKEEKTRVREHNDSLAKKQSQGPWIHLPNRPISHQRPYYQW